MHPTLETTIELPSRQSVRETFEFLLGRDVHAGDGVRVSLGMPSGAVTVGTIIDDRDRLAAVLVADLPLAVYAGACLGLMPAGGAADRVEDKELSATLNENFHEVLNVASSVFNLPEAPHVRLGPVYTDPDQMPPLVVVTANSVTRRDDISIDISGYGTGNLSVVLVD